MSPPRHHCLVLLPISTTVDLDRGTGTDCVAARSMEEMPHTQLVPRSKDDQAVRGSRLKLGTDVASMLGFYWTSRQSDLRLTIQSTGSVEHEILLPPEDKVQVYQTRVYNEL
jgi:hypothetical protein